MPRAKPYLGKLSTGQLYLLSNFKNRDTLIVSIGRPNELKLCRMRRIRHGKSGPPRFKGHAKSKQWSYPYGYEHDGNLYVVYSIGKEDCGLSVMPISSLAVPGAKEKKKKICFVAGKGSHGGGSHDFQRGCDLLAEQLNKNLPDVDAVVHKGGWPKDAKFFEGAAAIVVYCDGLKGHVMNPHMDQINEMWKKGVGIACLHYAVVPPASSGERFLDWMGGYYKLNWSVNPFWTADFKKFPDHPVTRGVKPFTIKDEWYYHMKFRDGMKGVTPVLSAHPPASTLKRKDGPHSGNPTVREAVRNGEIQHVAWVSESDEGGRGFGFTGAHYHKNWKDDNFRKLVLNAIAWIAKVEVPNDGVASQVGPDSK
jgi:type 1 glutamine amidotransferase